MRNLLTVVALGLATIACSRDKPAQGPAEQAGEQVDNAASDVEKGAERATENAGEKMEEAGDKAEQTTKDEE